MTDLGFLTSAALAEAAGVSGTSMTRLWRNQAAAKTVAAVAKTLGLEIPNRPAPDEDIQRWNIIGPEMKRRYPQHFENILMSCETRLTADRWYERMKDSLDEMAGKRQP